MTIEMISMTNNIVNGKNKQKQLSPQPNDTTQQLNHQNSINLPDKGNLIIISSSYFYLLFV